MNSDPISSPSDGTDPGFLRGVLHELIGIAMELARDLPKQEAGAEREVAFERISRAVRRTVMLVQLLDQPAPAVRARTLARKLVLRSLENDIDEKGGERREALHAELRERLDAPELEDDIAGRPAGEIIYEIKQDLQLGRDFDGRPYKRRTPADVALLHARAAAPAGGVATAGSGRRLAPHPDSLPRELRHSHTVHVAGVDDCPIPFVGGVRGGVAAPRSCACGPPPPAPPTREGEKYVLAARDV